MTAAPVGRTLEEATPEDRLLRSLLALNALVGALAERSPSEGADLLRLDRLVRRYPAAARASLQLLQPPPTALPAIRGWSAASDTGGLPLWRWDSGRVRVATSDTDQLRFLGVVLTRFDQMTAEELHAYLRR